MNTRTIGIIITREYLNRVKKKSFLLITFLTPLLFAALCILPSVIMVAAKEDSKKVAVVDESGLVMNVLSDTKTVSFADCAGEDVEQMKTRLADLGYDAVLKVSGIDPEKKTVAADIYSDKPLGMEMTELINARINDAVEDYRIASYNIEGLDAIMQDVKANVRLHSYTVDAEGKETISESAVFMIVSMILGMIIYMFIALFSGMVMSSVIEEKASRVVEVLISSVKATELMFGKIIGIAAVALTQFFLWIVLTFAIVGVAGAVGGKNFLNADDMTEMVQMNGISAEQMEAMTAAMQDSSELATIMSSVKSMPIAEIIICFIIYFVFGYMLYASLFAAVGSAVENEGDTQQLQLPITVPLLLGFFIAIYAYKAPGSGLVFWGSMIPFTSPIVMLARLPYGVPIWQLGLSIGLLVACFMLCAWASAKIYKVGILMFGKKSSWKDLWKWFKQS